MSLYFSLYWFNCTQGCFKWNSRALEVFLGDRNFLAIFMKSCFLHCKNCIFPKWYSRYVTPRGQNAFGHVRQICPDPRNATKPPARFLGVDQPLGTCASVTICWRVALARDTWLAGKSSRVWGNNQAARASLVDFVAPYPRWVGSME